MMIDMYSPHVLTALRAKARKGDDDMERLTVREAANYLQITPALLRYLMDRGELKIGKVVRNKKRNTYIIYRELIKEGVTS